jgi:Flp pilus assembly protein TadD
MMRIRIITAVLFLFPAAIISGQDVYDVILQSRALMDEGKAAKAVAVLSEFQPGKTDVRLLTLRGDAKLLTGDFEGAARDYKSAGSITPGSGDYGLARVYALAGDAVTSLHYLELTMKSSFRRSEKDIMLDKAFEKIENRPEWRQFWQKEWYTMADIKVSEIEYYVRAGKPDEARVHLDELESQYRGHSSALYAGSLIKIASGSFLEAAAILSDLLKSEPNDEKYLRALASAQTGALNHTGASITFSRLIEMEVPDAGLLLLRADCYRRTGERAKAMADIERYLSYYPGSREALSLAGRTESALGNNLKALEYLSENVRLHPNDPECYIERANSYFLSKSWQWAVNDYSMSLDLEPGNPEVYLSKGIALLNSGKMDDACYDFKKAFSLGSRKAVEYLSKYCIK